MGQIVLRQTDLTARVSPFLLERFCLLHTNLRLLRTASDSEIGLSSDAILDVS